MSVLLSPSAQKLRFTLFAPFYDSFVRMEGPRRRSLDRLALRSGERVLLVGAGTGADLPLLPPGVRAVATDVTPAMLARARGKARGDVRFAVMDAMDLDLPDAAFDAAILHLILALLPDPARCLAETARVVRPGGRIAVLDKFLPENGSAGLLRRVVNAGTRVLATDINLRVGDIVRDSRAPLRIAHDEPAAFAGLVRSVLLRREG
ncbi:MAG: class I SAM-dependent methyltransferase [Acidobacteriota bacterium]